MKSWVGLDRLYFIFQLLFYSLMLITFAQYTESGDLLFPIMTCKITLQCIKFTS